MVLYIHGIESKKTLGIYMYIYIYAYIYTYVYIYYTEYGVANGKTSDYKFFLLKS
jgi:hypothetical protein